MLPIHQGRFNDIEIRELLEEKRISLRVDARQILCSKEKIEVSETFCESF